MHLSYPVVKLNNKGQGSTGHRLQISTQLVSIFQVLTRQLEDLLNLQRASLSSSLSLRPLASLPSSLCRWADGLRVCVPPRDLLLSLPHRARGDALAVMCSRLGGPPDLAPVIYLSSLVVPLTAGTAALMRLGVSKNPGTRLRTPTCQVGFLTPALLSHYLQRRDGGSRGILLPCS